MAHTIRFTYNCDRELQIIDEDEIKDLIEMLYRWGDSSFNIIFEKKHRRWRGSAQWNSLEREHIVTLYVDNIRLDFKNGQTIASSQKANSLKVAAAMVLAHELQHCNQVTLYKQNSNSGFYSQHHYWNLPCEREARGFVDEKLNEICAYFGVAPVMRRAIPRMQDDVKEIKAVIKLLLECDKVTSDDINAELRASNLMSPANFSVVKHALEKKGLYCRR